MTFGYAVPGLAAGPHPPFGHLLPQAEEGSAVAWLAWLVPVIGYSTLMVWVRVWLAPGASSVTSGYAVPGLAAGPHPPFGHLLPQAGEGSVAGVAGAGDRLLDADGLGQGVAGARGQFDDV
ncbi:hypothetical protein, partial [Xanthomonas phaseoli]|uniref:hypothetical protein n=1 Tax=Xanthomonas phaseoli TaxID=1985254 RepID=UPI001ED96D7C